ncbi:hypothetical protein [Coleofasciculus sp. C1-SOL-03]|uniref:hypothetical protein n=1 Tax=Coleofasciculus sp. C1-SOL-03 TaxID=3069522 RepID=UPI004063A70D
MSATNSAIACSLWVNSIVRSLPFSYSHQFYRAHVGAPLRAGDKRCDRLFSSGQFHRAIAA